MSPAETVRMIEAAKVRIDQAVESFADAWAACEEAAEPTLLLELEQITQHAEALKRKITARITELQEGPEL